MRGTSQVGHNHCVQRTVAIRSHQPQTVRQWRLAPAADAARWANIPCVGWR